MSTPHRTTKRQILSILGVMGLIVFELVLVQLGNSQKIVEPSRMGFEMKCPTYILAPGQSMMLRADLFGAKEILGEEKAKLIAYRWEICGGTIIAGLGTPEITINSLGVRPPDINLIKVELKLDGVPPDFQNERSCLLKIDPQCQPPILFRQYGDIPLKDEQKILDRLGEQLTTRSPLVAFLVVYAGPNSCLREAEWRAKRAEKYLVESHKIDANRVIAIDGGFRETLTIDLFTATRDSCGPFPKPTMLGSMANAFGSCAEKLGKPGIIP